MASLSNSHNTFKIAIVHDVLIDYGGAERVLEELMELFPSADVYTFYFNESNSLLKRFSSRITGTSPLQLLPRLNYLGAIFSLFKLFSPLYFYLLNMRSYDLVISSCHSFNSKILRRRKGAIHLSYIHTPPHYLYGYTNEVVVTTPFFKYLLSAIYKVLRKVDYFAAQQPDVLVANSVVTQRRIYKHYRRISEVVYPPVKVSTYKVHHRRPGRYFITHSRLVKQKRVELAVKTCTKYDLPLVVVGDGYLRKSLQKISGKTINFVGQVSDDQLNSLYTQAKAFLFCAIEEDFGMTPVEAMAHGVPVVAYRSGGVVETVVPGKTGVLFDKHTIRGLKSAIDQLEKLTIDPNDCYERAKRFDRKHFRRAILDVVRKQMKIT